MKHFQKQDQRTFVNLNCKNINNKNNVCDLTVSVCSVLYLTLMLQKLAEILKISTGSTGFKKSQTSFLLKGSGPVTQSAVRFTFSPVVTLPQCSLLMSSLHLSMKPQISR